MATQSLLFASIWLLVSVGDNFGNSFGLRKTVSVDSNLKLTPKCTGNCSHELPAPKTCGCAKPIKEEKCEDFFASMSRSEYLTHVNQIVRVGDRNAQKAFDNCACQFLPKKTADALKRCGKQITGHSMGQGFYDAMAADPILALGIYDCVIETGEKLTPKEKEKLLKYEKCFKALKPRCGGQN